MHEYGHYVAYRNATNEIRQRVEEVQHTRKPGPPWRRPRQALARGLHSLAERLEG